MGSEMCIRDSSYEYLFGAIAAGLILLVARDLSHIAAPAGWPAGLQVLWLAVALLFGPSVLLGMITPMIVKLSLRSLDATGRVVGRIRAAAELGAIAGVFLTGFVLIDAFGTPSIVASVAIVLAVLAVLSNPLWSVAASRVRGREVEAES